MLTAPTTPTSAAWDPSSAWRSIAHFTTSPREEMGQLARDTGGRTFQATSLDAARDAFAEVAAEIGRQYSIGYYSTNPSTDGRFRTDSCGPAWNNRRAGERARRLQDNSTIIVLSLTKLLTGVRQMC
jgi:hypothetical protein